MRTKSGPRYWPSILWTNYPLKLIFNHLQVCASQQQKCAPQKTAFSLSKNCDKGVWVLEQAVTSQPAECQGQDSP